MKYFSSESVANAYKGFQGSITNKSWGVLAIMHQLDSMIVPGRTYAVNCSSLSTYIEKLFCLGSKKSYIDNGKEWYVKFSTQWNDFFDKQGQTIPNIFDIIVWAYRTSPLPDDITHDKLLAMFAKDFHLSVVDINNTFDTREKRIEYNDTLYSDSNLLSIVAGKLGTSLSKNITADGKSVAASPGELSRGPFVQPLYAALDTADYILVSQTNFDELYPMGGPRKVILPLNNLCKSVNAYLTAIRTKPFLLLAGISGTGKSRIVRELAFMTCPKKLQDEDGTTPGNYCMIEVKPNWHDSSELLGYYSSFNGGGYRFTKFDRFVVKAWLNPDVPFFVCLDEMNLAPVEQYFAEFLSVLETRSRDKEGNVVTGALVDKQYFKDDTKMKEDLGLDGADDWIIKVRSDLVNKGLTLPPNLIVIGTVNMDDTTYQFSRKVIDRAMTIEMNGGELSQMFGNSNNLKYRSDEDIVKLGLFKAPYINADEVIERYQSQTNIIKEKLPEKLEAINTALKDTPFQVSYRVLNELVIYLGALMDEATAKGESIDDDALSALMDQAIDQITLMKILPRIEGDDDMFKRNGGTNILKTLQSLFSEDTDSYRKLDEMTDRLNRTGFTRFWP